MAGAKRLRRVQYGKETTAGTGVAATAKWTGNGVLVDEGPIERIDRDEGNLIPTSDSYAPYAEGSISLDEAPARFEDIVWVFAGGIENVTTGVADGSGSGKIYQFDFPTTTAPSDPKTFSIEGGNDQECDELDYAYCEEFQLSGAAQEAVMVSATFRGQALVDTSFTAGQSVPTGEVILFQKGKVYVDDAAVGTSLKSSSLMGFEFGGPTGWKGIYAADGSLSFGAIENTGPELTGSFTWRHDATGEAERGKAQARTPRYVRLLFEGSELTTAGTTYTYKTLKVDFVCLYDEVPSLEDQDGHDVYTIPFTVTNDTAPQIIVVNEVANI